jgi:hypothetical protein
MFMRRCLAGPDFATLTGLKERLKIKLFSWCGHFSSEAVKCNLCVSQNELPSFLPA